MVGDVRRRRFKSESIMGVRTMWWRGTAVKRGMMCRRGIVCGLPA
jgi:hypothetical protein